MKRPDVPSLNRSLKIFRKFYNISQSKLADRMGVSKSFISEVESGKRNVTINIVNKCATVFEVPASEILALAEFYDGQYQKGRSNIFTKVIEWISDDDDMALSYKTPKKGDSGSTDMKIGGVI